MILAALSEKFLHAMQSGYTSLATPDGFIPYSPPVEVAAQTEAAVTDARKLADAIVAGVAVNTAAGQRHAAG
jgi:hypothetical protein